MNHCVPTFEREEDGSITTNRSKRSSMAEAKIMELLWQNGEVVTQSHTQRSPRKSHLGGASAEQREIRSDEETAANNQLFMQEDEMASWLQYPLDDSSFDRDFYAYLLGPTAPSGPVATAVPSPPPQGVAPLLPMPPQRRVEPSMESPPPQQTYQNFSHFSRLKGRIESRPSSSKKAGKVSTVEDSNGKPLTPGLESRVLWGADNTPLVSGGNIGYSIPAAAANTSPAACELTVSSSPGGSGASAASAEPIQKLTGGTATATEDRKRKATKIDDGECQSEKDVESESAHAKKKAHRSTSTKRSRAAEVHNLSERRRRDRINEKMKALQDLIPRCNKSDKASMLDEAIEYLKSLQMQVQQMMSMGCGMVPMMFPGAHLSPMGMGMGMGMNRPMVPYSSVLLGSALQNPAAAVHLAPRFPMPGFHMPLVPPSDPSRMQATAQSDVMRSTLASQNPNQSRVSNFSPYQQYRGIHQPPVPLTQNQAVVQPSPSKPSSSREVGNPDNGQSD